MGAYAQKHNISSYKVPYVTTHQDNETTVQQKLFLNNFQHYTISRRRSFFLQLLNNLFIWGRCQYSMKSVWRTENSSRSWFSTTIEQSEQKICGWKQQHQLPWLGGVSLFQTVASFTFLPRYQKVSAILHSIYLEGILLCVFMIPALTVVQYKHRDHNFKDCISYPSAFLRLYTRKETLMHKM